MKLVQFQNGTYGVRRWWFGFQFLEVFPKGSKDRIPSWDSYYWHKGEYEFPSIQAAQEAIFARQIFEAAHKDKGTPIKKVGPLSKDT